MAWPRPCTIASSAYSVDALQGAITCQRAAVSLSASADPRTLGRRNNLSGYLIEWYDHTNDAAALTEAIEILEDLESSSAGRLERPSVLQHLANALHRMAAHNFSWPGGDGGAWLRPKRGSNEPGSCGRYCAWNCRRKAPTIPVCSEIWQRPCSVSTA